MSMGFLRVYVDVTDKEKLKKEFEKLFPHTKVLVDVKNAELNIVVTKDYSADYLLSFQNLVKVAELLGTDKFGVLIDKETVSGGTSWTPDTESIFEITFSVNLTKINTGFPWKEGYFNDK